MSKQSWEKMYEQGTHGTSRTVPDETIFKFLQKIKDKLSIDAKILDIGCGRGINTKEIQKIGYDTYGCDIAENAVASAQSEGMNAIFGDMYKLPYENNFFDAVYTNNTLKNEKEKIEISLKEINRVLKNSGLAYLAFFEKVECKKPDPNKPDEYVSKEKLHEIILKYFTVIDKKYDIWTDFPGTDDTGEKGEHTHHRICLFVKKTKQV